jgi:hypothetical protein
VPYDTWLARASPPGAAGRALQREEGGEARLIKLHVIREYALEQLEASGEAGSRQAFPGIGRTNASLGPDGRGGLHGWTARTRHA